MKVEHAGMERKADSMQPGWLSATANAHCCSAHTGAAGQRKRAVGFAWQNGYQNATEHPAETQLTTASHHRALQELYVHFFSVSKFSHEICSVSVCAYKAQLKTMIYAPPRAVRRILPPSAMKVAQYFHPGGAHVFKYLLLSSPY